jgi:hypothetical protein
MIDLTNNPLLTDPLGWGKAQRLAATISSQDRDALLDELESAGKLSLPLSGQQDYLNTPKLYDLGAAPSVEVDHITGAALKTFLRGILNRALQAGGTVATKWAGLSAAVTPTISDSEVVLLTSQTLASFAAQMSADGILQAGEIEALFSVPDPTWQREVWRTPAAHVLGKPVIVTSEDIA